MSTEPLPWYSDVCTAVCPVFLGHFCFARIPTGLDKDEALPARQTVAKPMTSSAPSHTHTHTDLETSWHIGMLFLSFRDNADLGRVKKAVPMRLPGPILSPLSITSSGSFLLSLSPHNIPTFQRENTQLAYAVLRYQINGLHYTQMHAFQHSGAT